MSPKRKDQLLEPLQEDTPLPSRETDASKAAMASASPAQQPQQQQQQSNQHTDNPSDPPVTRSTRSHKRHKSWDVSSQTPTLPQPTIPPAEHHPYARSRSRSPLKHNIVEQDEEMRHTPQRSRRASVFPNASDWLRDTVGISVEDWPYSQELLSSAVELKLEQERTKRANLKLHSLQTTIDMLKLAVDSNVPPHLIPYMMANGELRAHEMMEARDDSKSKSPQKTQKTATSVFKVNIPQQTQFQFHHWQKPGDYKEERKRKASEEPQQQPQQQPQQTQTPTRHSSGSHTHRRNQSEANVSHLRSLYETQAQQQQHQQLPQRLPQQGVPQAIPQPPHVYQAHQQHWSTTPQLASPYLPTREAQQQQQQQQARPLYYPYQNPQQPRTYISSAGPPPPMGFQFPRRDMPPPQPPATQQQPQPPATQLPPVQTQKRGTQSATASPVAAGKKSDVSFLISTPNNPPK